MNTIKDFFRGLAGFSLLAISLFGAYTIGMILLYGWIVGTDLDLIMTPHWTLSSEDASKARWVLWTIIFIWGSIGFGRALRDPDPDEA